MNPKRPASLRLYWRPPCGDSSSNSSRMSPRNPPPPETGVRQPFVRADLDQQNHVRCGASALVVDALATRREVELCVSFELVDKVSG